MSPRVRFALKIIFTVAILGFLIRKAGLRNILGALNSANVVLLLPMYVFVACRAVLQSFLTHMLLKRVGSSATILRVFLASTLASFYGLVVPGDIVASFAKWKNLSLATGQKASVLNAMVYQRLLLIIISLAIGLIALALENPIPEYPIAAVSSLLLLIFFILGMLLFSPRVGLVVDPLLQRIALKLPGALGCKMGNVIASLGEFRRLSLSHHAQFVSLGLLTVGFMIASLAIAGHALTLDLSLTTVAWLQVMLLLLRTIPITVGNLGVRETFLIFVLAAYGIEPATAIALGLLLFSRELFIAIIGGLYQTALLFGWAQTGSARKSPGHVPDSLRQG